jgi:hypothetical protein
VNCSCLNRRAHLDASHARWMCQLQLARLEWQLGTECAPSCAAARTPVQNKQPWGCACVVVLTCAGLLGAKCLSGRSGAVAWLPIGMHVVFRT